MIFDPSTPPCGLNMLYDNRDNNNLNFIDTTIKQSLYSAMVNPQKQINNLPS